MDTHWTATERRPREPFDVADGAWWRVDRYAIRDGCICPASDARLNGYDPWEHYRASRAADSRVDPPYTSLLTLVGALEADLETAIDGQNVRLGMSGQRILVDWCARYGLLGLLPHQTVLASLAPRWESLGASPKCVPVRHVHRWDAYGWDAAFDVWLPPVDALRGEVRAGDLLAPAAYIGLWPEPLALMHMIRDGGWSTQSLADAWGPYFPNVPASERSTYSYPLPASDRFCVEYCEPVSWFLGAASQLREALLVLEPDVTAPKPPDLFVQGLDRGLRTLHNLLAPVQLSITVDRDGQYRQTWRTRSLLSSFALMALLDLTERRRVLSCATCGRVFVSAAPGAQYCSVRCRGTAQKRGYRARIQARSTRTHSTPAG